MVLFPPARRLLAAEPPAPALPLPPARPEVGCEIWCGKEAVTEIWESEGEAPRSVLCVISKKDRLPESEEKTKKLRTSSCRCSSPLDFPLQ
jgi:hypothetical protein